MNKIFKSFLALFFGFGLAAADAPVISVQDQIFGRIKSHGLAALAQNLQLIIKQAQNLGLQNDLEDVLIEAEIYLDQACYSVEAEKDVYELFRALATGQKKVLNMGILGRTREGKSAFRSVLVKPLDKAYYIENTSPSLESHTVEASPHIAIFKSTRNGLYVARIIDTPGFSEMKLLGSSMKARTDTEVMAEITSKLEGIKLDRVLLVCPLNLGLMEGTKSAFTLAITEFAKKGIFTGKIDLVVPRLDVLQHTLKPLVDELVKSNHFFDDNKDSIGKQFLTGVIFATTLQSINDRLESAKLVLTRRNLFFQEIFEKGFKEHLTVTLDNGIQKIELSDAAKEKIASQYPKQEEQAINWSNLLELSEEEESEPANQ